MNLKEAIEILEHHQKWRRDNNVPPKVKMQNPVKIGEAIDYALIRLKNLKEKK